MLEDQSYPIPNSDSLDKYIFPQAPGTEPDILAVRSNGGKELTSDIYPPHKD